MRTAVLVFDGFEDLDAFGPLNVLAMAGFDVSLASLQAPRPVVSAHGTTVVPVPLAHDAELIVVPGGGWLTRAERGAWAQARHGELPAALAAASAQGAVLASVSTGALLLAAAGVLDGRPAVTNRAALDDLAAAGAHVVTDARVVDDGDVVTAGGLTAGIDLALWLVERQRGVAVALGIARDLEHRPAGYVRRRVTALDAAAAGPDGPGAPRTALEAVAYDTARLTEPAVLFHHSVRSYLFAQVAAQARGWRPGSEFDDETLYAACLLHDIGLTAATDTGARFEVDGADAGVHVLAAAGMDERRLTVVWDAVALHTSTGIAERKQPEVALARAGIEIDFGFGADLVPDATAAMVHERWPRLDITRYIVDATVAQVAGRPAKAPPGSAPGEVVRERSVPPYTTHLERRATSSRWGC